MSVVLPPYMEGKLADIEMKILGIVCAQILSYSYIP